MIIAPLITPIMGLSYGVVQFSWSQIVRSAITVFLGVVVVMAISFLSTRYIEIKVAGTEMLSRAFPSLLDLGVAMAAGAAGAFSLSHESIRSSIAASILLMQPLSEELQKLRVKSMVLRLVKTLPVTHPDTFESTMRLDTLRVRHDEDDVLHVLAEGTVPRDRLEGGQARLDLFRHELEEKVGEPVIIEIEAVPVDIVHFRSAPDGDNDQGAQSSPTISE